MALHHRTHPEYVEGCFSCKVVGLNFGTVPGAYRALNSKTMFDKDALLSQLSDKDGNPVFSKERVEDKRSDFRRHMKEFRDASA